MNKNDQDLGFGAKVVEQTKGRFLLPNGTFSAKRKIDGFGSASLYHAILNKSWPRFYLWTLFLYAFANLIFALGYLGLGRSVFPDIAGQPSLERFFELLSYSVQVITTLGSSPLHPVGALGHLVLAIEAFTGLIGFSLIAGLTFARFSNPSIKMQFSDHAVVGPYQNITALMFRLVNARTDELIDVEAEVALSYLDKQGSRKFVELPLERTKVTFFPLSWTVVHPITVESPLYGMTPEDYAKADVELLIFISAIDENLSRNVHVKTSYKYYEMLFNTKFANIIERDEVGNLVVNPDRIHEVDNLELVSK